MSVCVCVCVYTCETDRERESEIKNDQPFYIYILNLVLLRGVGNQHKCCLEIFGKNWPFIGRGGSLLIKKGMGKQMTRHMQGSLLI